MVTEYTKKPISTLLRASNTVFTLSEMGILWGETDRKALTEAARYYVRTGQLYKIRRGLYAKDRNYSHLELSTKIITPAYVSFETVLVRNDMIFQVYSQIFLASYVARELVIEGQRYIFRRINDEILVNPAGIDRLENVSQASPERAYLDMLYLHKDFYFDNLRPLNWSKVLDILPIYRNKRLERVVNSQRKRYELQRSHT